MSPAEETPAAEPRAQPPFSEVRYSLTDLLQEVKRDRASSAFAMEKLDQPAITALFELQQKRARLDPDVDQ